jgi:hypothetical protein
MFVEGDGNHNDIKIDLEFHVCSEKDFEKFSEPDKSSLNLINHLKEQESMYCLSGTDKEGNYVDMHVSGDSESVPHRRLEIDF